MTSTETLKAAAAKHSTDVLIGALLLLDTKASKDEAERMVYAATADVVTEREGIDAALDSIFGNLDFTGTYTDAILLAIAAREVVA